jgi:hypothetical protein
MSRESVADYILRNPEASDEAIAAECRVTRSYVQQVQSALGRSPRPHKAATIDLITTLCGIPGRAVCRICFDRMGSNLASKALTRLSGRVVHPSLVLYHASRGKAPHREQVETLRKVFTDSQHLSDYVHYLEPIDHE